MYLSLFAGSKDKKGRALEARYSTFSLVAFFVFFLIYFVPILFFLMVCSVFCSSGGDLEKRTRRSGRRSKRGLSAGASSKQ